MKSLVVTALGVLLGAGTFGCSLGQGDGAVTSPHLYAPDCWGVEPTPDARPAYDLQPDFFAAIPYRNSLQIRVQRGSDLEQVSDGLFLLIDDVPTLRSRLGRAEVVSVPAGVQPPGSPLPPQTTPLLAGPSLVHMGLYLLYSCHNQNTTLNAIGGTITFSKLFSGDPNEKVGAEKLTDAKFDIMVADLADVVPGQPVTDVPADKQSHVVGHFSFYFERGQPAQPFP